MTIAGLKTMIDRLDKELPPDTVVVMASDAEGNSLHHIDEIAVDSVQNPTLCIWPNHDSIAQ